MNPTSKAKAGLAVIMYYVRKCTEWMKFDDAYLSAHHATGSLPSWMTRIDTLASIRAQISLAESVDLDGLAIVSFSDASDGDVRFATSGSDAANVVERAASTIDKNVLLLLGYRCMRVRPEDFLYFEKGRARCISIDVSATARWLPDECNVMSAAFGMTLQDMHDSVDAVSATDIAARLKANADAISDHMQQGPNVGFTVSFFPSFGLAPLWFLKGDDAEETKRIIETELQGAWPPSSEGVSITVESWMIDPQHTRFVRPGTPSGRTVLVQAICILRSGYVHAEGLGIQAYRRAKEAMDAEAIQRPNSSWSDRMHYFAKHMMASRPGLVFTEHDSRWAITVLRRTPVKDEETKK